MARLSLSQLVGFRNKLNKTLTVDGMLSAIEVLTTDVGNLYVEDQTHQVFLQNCIKQFNNIEEQIYTLTNQLAEHNKIIAVELEEVSRKFYASNYDLELAYDNPQAIREVRKLPVPTEAVETFKKRIAMYVDWRFPILELGCRDGEMTGELVAGDPLYIVDNYQEFVENARLQFSEVFQNRIRPYVIRDQGPNGPGLDQLDCEKLPYGQFGYIFSYNYFNYCSIQGIKDYLTYAIKLLRPGGTMMFTYNNADIEQQAAHAENYFMSYMPKSILIPLCQSLGFDITADYDVGQLSWVEIRKPGELTTIKAHQALGKIQDVAMYPKELTF
jgi:hypothetical protein